MAYDTFPTFPGVAWDIAKRQFWSTDFETSASGVEYRTAYWAEPIHEFDLTFNYLSQTDVETLEAFYAAHQGPLIPFYLSIPNDAGSPYLVRFVDGSDSNGNTGFAGATAGALQHTQFANAMYSQDGITLREVR